MNNKLKTVDIAYIGLSVAIMAVCAGISIPTTVPFTLQTFAIYCALETLGAKRGNIAIWVYILLGAIGLPVFSGFKGGLGVLLGTTGGYILGFIATGLIYWVSERFVGRSLPARIIAMVLGLFACYALGTVWFVQVYTSTKGAVSYGSALAWCVFPFVVPDLGKMAVAVAIASRVRKIVKIQNA